MKLSSRILGYREFWGEEDIRFLIKRSKNFTSDESPDKAKSLLIFQTSKQQTWLVSTSKRLYCILDDIRKRSPKIQWSTAKESFGSGANYIAAISTRTKTEKTGLVDIGPMHKNWLYTKAFFNKVSIEKEIDALLSKT